MRKIKKVNKGMKLAVSRELILLGVILLGVALFVGVTRKATAGVTLIDPLPTGMVGVPYPPTHMVGSVNVDINPPYEVTVASGNLPAGLVINGDVLSGTPLEAVDDSGMMFWVNNLYEVSSRLTISANTNPVVSTGKKVNDKGTITIVKEDYLVVNNKTIIRLTNETKLKLKKEPALAVGQLIHYKGILNTDGSVTADGFVMKQ